MDRRNEDINMEEVLKSIEEPKDVPRNVVTGKIIQIVEDGVVVDYGGKFEGFVSQQHLVRPLAEYKIGDESRFEILRIDYDNGRAYLSERRPVYRETLKKIEDIWNSDERIVRGIIAGEMRGGYKVLIYGVVEGFLPGSQSLIKRGDRIPEGELEFEIINFERRGRRNNIVLSRKSIVEKKRKVVLDSLKEGDVVKGKVVDVKDFGVFVELGEGVTGLLPRSEVSYGRVISLREMFSPGDELELKIIYLDKAAEKITLSLKALMPDPFDEYLKEHDVGSIVSGRVLKIRNNGFTVKLSEDVVGFVPVEEIFWGRTGRIRDVVKEGDVVELEIVEVDKDKRRIILSYKKAKGDPWDNIEEKYKVGEIYEGRIVRVLQTGVIVELEDGVSGFVPVSEISWNYFEKVSDVLRERRKVKVKVLEIDKENRRMRLSIKGAKENPWDKVLKEIDRDSIVKGKVINVLHSGYIVRIENYGVDAFLPISHVEGDLKKGDEVEAVVLRILDDRKMGKRMIISVKDLEEKKALMEYKKEAEKNMKQKTLGDVLKKVKEDG